MPGFVDLHINGIAGVDFLTADADGYVRASEALATVGVVAYQPTFVSSPRDAYAAAAVGRRATAMAGPGRRARASWVCTSRAPSCRRSGPARTTPRTCVSPDTELAERLREVGPVTTMTLAPELEGALDLVDRLVARGVMVSIGHSDADAAIAHAAFDRGARAMTHMHNAHRRWRPRDPGAGGVALVRPEVRVQAIVDGVHLAPESALGAFLAAGPRFCLVTDAIEAADAAGEYDLGDREVRRSDGAVRLAGRHAGRAAC